MTGKIKLELTWIGKDNRPRLEPRILLEDPEKSYHAAKKVGEADIFDNRLIFGDNLLALKALEQEFAGKIKCIYIDPPYNTGSAFAHYDDGIEHSLWLSMMRDRLEVLRRLLAPDGSLWMTIDHNEAHYLKVLCDEVFGRSSFIASVIWRTSDSSNNNVTQFSLDHNEILVYALDPNWRPRFQNDPSKRKHFKNPDGDPRGPWFDGNNLQNPGLRPNLQFNITSPTGHVIKHPPNGWRWSRDTIEAKLKTGEIRFSDDGKRLIRRTYLADMEGLPPSTLWTDLEETGHNRQAKYELKNLFSEVPVSQLFGTPKPEKLIHKILTLASDQGDLVLDSFAGSGTTGAVAHKMRRRWIMVELGDHCHSHILPRLRRIIDGSDPNGISEIAEWRGGGGFRYFTLAPSLLEKDFFGNWIISKKYKPEQLTEAICKLEGFIYAPSDTVYWQHGHSTESDFLYATTQTLTRDQLAHLSDEVGPKRTLLVLCAAFRAKGLEEFPNLTVKKIPKTILNRCEWGHDDYSLEIKNLPAAREPDPTPPPGENGGPRSKKKRPADMPLFGTEGGDQ